MKYLSFIELHSLEQPPRPDALQYNGIAALINTMFDAANKTSIRHCKNAEANFDHNYIIKRRKGIERKDYHNYRLIRFNFDEW